MRDIKKEQAITLIALVVTLVILIILAAVSINMVLGDQGIFKKAQEGANSMHDAEVNTQLAFNSITDEIEQVLQGTEKATDIYVFLYNDGTLAFGTQNKSIEGKNVEKEYGNIKGKEYSSWTDEDDNRMSDTPWFNDSALITKVSIVDKIVPLTMSSWFDSCINLTEFENIENIDTSEVKSMQWLFDTCTSLTNLDLSSFDTSNVIDMGAMFAYCNNLTEIQGLENFDTSKVKNMESMFFYCDSLINLNLSNFDTSNVEKTGWMFCHCSSLTSLDVNSFNTSNVIIMESMFAGCTNLITIQGLENFDTSKVENMVSMFYHCINLTSLNLSSFNTSNVKSTGWMFENCSSLTSLDLSSFDTSNMQVMESIFAGCTSLTTIYVGNNWNLLNVENTKSMFSNCGTNTTTLKESNV